MLRFHYPAKILTFVWLLSAFTGFGGNNPPDSENFYPDSLLLISDTVPSPDTLANDTTVKIIADTTVHGQKRTTLEHKVERTAKDSIIQDIKAKKAYLYGDAVVTYGDITLKAAYIEFDFNNNTVYAKGMPDSTGKIRGLPEFTEGDDTFKAKEMHYNFDTKKGIINSVTTEDQQGFLHGTKVKKEPDNSVNVKSGYYTTCNLPDHPHFEFRFSKARVIPKDKIVTGPVYLEIEGVPTPIALPFGFFPNNTQRQSGIVIPTYGESPKRGFFLEGGGYYWHINEYMDLKVTGDIYTHGSWKISPQFRYKKRYKYSGSFSVGYARNILGVKGEPDYSNSRDFSIRWSHRQDPKARPRSSFSANVNIVSSNFITYNTVSVNDYLSNEFQSSVAYQTNWAGKYFLTVNASHRQNTKTHAMDVTLPELTFSVNRFYPLRSKKGGKKRFYEDLSISYAMNAKNTLSATDSTFFEPDVLKTMKNGVVHKLPVSLPLKVLKYFTLSNSINITDRMYASQLRRYWTNDTLITSTDTLAGYLKTDTVPGFNNVFDYSISSSLSTKLYGMILFKKGPVRAIRHVLTPNIGFSYTPDFGAEKWGYYDYYYDTTGNKIIYSKYDQYLYGTAPFHKSGSINVSLANNLEIKVPSRKDTVTGLKKVKLIENFTVSGSYNLALDSLNMSPVSMSGRTRLWKNLTIQYSSRWNPYAVDSTGRPYNRFEWEVHRKLLRRENTTWNLSFSLSLNEKMFNKNKKSGKQTNAVPNNLQGDNAELEAIEQNKNGYIDWTIPWSLSLNYNFRYSNILSYTDMIWTPQKTIVQTLSVKGQINITPKWKFTFQSGWDFKNKQLAFTQINLYRDLHCWEMRFNWIPIGARKSWSFSINAKASLLQDLKLTKKKDFRDF